MEAGKRAESLLLASLAHEPTRRLGEEHDEEGERNSGSDLKTKGESPLEDGAGLVKTAAVDNETGDKSTNTEEELLESSEPSSDGRVGNLGLVERGKERKHTNTDTGEETTGHHHTLVLSCGLENTTENEDDGTDHDGETTREGIGNERGWDATNEGTEQHRTDDESDIVGIWIVGHAEEVGRHDDTSNDTEICYHVSYSYFKKWYVSVITYMVLRHRDDTYHNQRGWNRELQSIRRAMCKAWVGAPL